MVNTTAGPITALTLTSGGYRVLVAADGEEAVSAAQEHHPDVILLDGEMPRLHGFDACRQIKADPSTQNITVIMVTAKAQDEDRQRGLEAGADGYIRKPFSPRELLEHLRSLSAA